MLALSTQVLALQNIHVQHQFLKSVLIAIISYVLAGRFKVDGNRKIYRFCEAQDGLQEEKHQYYRPSNILQKKSRSSSFCQNMAEDILAQKEQQYFIRLCNSQTVGELVTLLGPTLQTEMG